MIRLGAQYYRPPFPETRHWRDDLRRMRDAGLDTVQLWVLWGWVEPEPGRFVFDDYDELTAGAAAAGLRVVLSTIAEIQPVWIHRIEPGSEMISTAGQTIRSGNRNECHFGLTPGGCTDHPGVWARMACFLDTVARRYGALPHLHGWDVWNELRWNVHADALVCCCPHTLRAYRDWLNRRCGGLDGLNALWRTRYTDWADVCPEKAPGRPYTRLMSFAHFITWRAVEHARARYAVVKAADPRHPVTLHGGQPSAEHTGHETLTPLDRTNDWFFADILDGVGTSSFPKWFQIDDADFGMRVEFVKSAARDKAVWLSELQGGRAASGFELFAPVDALAQQRWVWNGVACGADTILFWCWRDEVFCREAAGFGLTGRDGMADERLAAMRVTGRVLRTHGDTLSAYRPDAGRVGVLFSPQSYYHHWATDPHGAHRAGEGLKGYARALVRRSIPYTVVEEEHLDVLDDLAILFLPRLSVATPALEMALAAFVRRGGTLVCEAECGAFSPEGFYREPAARLTARLTGRVEVGRRHPTGASLSLTADGQAWTVAAAQWLTPLAPGPGQAWSAHPDGDLGVDAPCGPGRVVLVGAYLGDEYYRRQHSPAAADRAHGPGFERWVEWLVRRAGVPPAIEIIEPVPDADQFLYVKSGLSGARRLLFVFFQATHTRARLRFPTGMFGADRVTDLLTGEVHNLARTPTGVALELTASEWRFAVLLEN